MSALESRIASLKLIPSGGGRFEVVVNGKLVYSKLSTGRHTTPEEVIALIQKEV